MHIYRLYGHPLKVARIRQYLHEGVEKYRMRGIAEAVPGLVHISLLLFFAGLADFLQNTYRRVGTAAIVLLSLYTLLYTIATLAPIVDPQSPFRTPFSRLVWRVYQSMRKQVCNDRFALRKELLSKNMIKGQMQLAMAKDDARMHRDDQSILWLIDNLTTDVEVEPLASGIPGSVDAKWGLDVWKNKPKPKKTIEPKPEEKDEPQPEKDGPRPEKKEPKAEKKKAVQAEKKGELIKRIGRLLETCNDRGSFMNDEDWRKRSRACVETVASFAFCMDVDARAFSNMGMGKLLSDLGSVERTCEVTETTCNRSFAIRWTCLSLASTRTMLNSEKIQQRANGALSTLAVLFLEDNCTPPQRALRNAQMIDDQFGLAWCLVEGLGQELKGLGDKDRAGRSIEEVLRRHEPKLKWIRDQFSLMARVDSSISELQLQIDEVTHNLTRQIPGVVSDHLTGFTPVEKVFEFFANPARPQLIYSSQLLRGLCTISRQRSSRGYQDTIKALEAAEKIRPSLRPAEKQHRLMERQLWRLEDLRAGGAFGFTLELYFLSIKHILSTFTSPLKEIHKTLYVNTFKAITLDWKNFTKSTGTMQIILNLVYDIAFEDRGIFSNFKYPDSVTGQLLDLLSWMIEGQEEVYARDASEELWRNDLKFYEEESWSSEEFQTRAVNIVLHPK
jgi:hypothetical protein